MRRLLNEITTVAHRILIELLRVRRSLVFWVVFPTLMLLLFGLIYAGGKQTAKSFDFTAPGILIGVPLSSISLQHVGLEHAYIEVYSYPDYIDMEK